jgi:hypothetical protein
LKYFLKIIQEADLIGSKEVNLSQNTINKTEIELIPDVSLIDFIRELFSP